MYDEAHPPANIGVDGQDGSVPPPAFVTTPPSSSSDMPEDWKRRAIDAEEKLRAYVERETAGLRQRGGQAVQKTTEVVEATAQQAREAPAGVKVQLVAVLCLVSFLLAYFFF